MRMEETKLQNDYVRGKNVYKIALPDIVEVQYLFVEPYTEILEHDHDGKQWEAWLHLACRTAYICPKGEKHRLENKKGSATVVMAIKGTEDYSYEELACFFARFGFKTFHGAMILSN